MHRPSTAFSPSFTLVELTAILASGGLLLTHLPTLVSAGAANVVIAPAMLVFADLGSGVVHWAFDRWGDETTPIVGPNLVRTFREHHVDPVAMTRHSFVEANGGPAFATTAFLTVALCQPPLLSAALVWLSVFVFVTNIVHMWAHGPAPAFARRLQRWGLILSPAHHAGHHTAPYTQGYCITTGWCNPLLDRHQVWRRLEAAITSITGVAPAGGLSA